MPLPALIVPVLMAARRGGRGRRSSSRPIRGRRSSARWASRSALASTGEAPIARWFGQADRNRDGMLTADEMQADADRFFARLDSNHDGQIDPEELKTYEWEIAPDVQVNSNWKRPRGETAAAKSEPNPRSHFR